MTVKRIVSGAQTGADRAALDVALALGVESGGWVPKGRLDENGKIPLRYPNLAESDSEDPKVRTELNVRDSDATLILSHGPLSGGSKYTEQKAIELGKPFKHLDLASMSIECALSDARRWLATTQPRTLNVAGPRASNDPEIYAKTEWILKRLLVSDD
ncbi:MAG TPA: putative molybdenum carrier protein [Candidatus Binatia bacterium]|nr:putative molybdenum carrier protein [Candidatus Binatia bacterium]